MRPISEIEPYRVTRGLTATPEGTPCGHFRIPIKESTHAQVIFDAGLESGWEHASTVIVYKNQRGKITRRTATWQEMARIKDVFWLPEECVIQFHPPQSEYVNIHAHCLHQWRNIAAPTPTPPLELI